MTTQWKQVSQAQAEADPLYGAGGWLLVWAVLAVVGLVREWAVAMVVAHSWGMTIGELIQSNEPAGKYLLAALVVSTGSVLLLLHLMFSKAPIFPATAITVLLLLTPGAMLLRLALDLSSLAGEVSTLLGWAVVCAIWVPYFRKSRRVQVTYHHLVRDEVHADTPPTALGSGSRGTVIAAAPNHRRSEPTEAMWAAALAEAEGRGRRDGLWAQVLTRNDGVETRARMDYIKARVIQLAEERDVDERLEAEEQASREAKEKLEKELEGLSVAEREEALAPKGHCPNCDTLLRMDTVSCKNCKAEFTLPGGWRPVPA